GLMRRLGRGCIIAGMVASGVAVAAFPWGGCLLGWFLLRAANGGASAIALVPLETLISQQSPPDQRARTFGFYALAVGLGMALGTWVGLQLYAVAGGLAFLLGGLAAVAAAGLFFLWLPSLSPPEQQATRHRLPWGRHLL